MSGQHTMVDERRYKKALAEIERLRHEITTRSPDEAQAEIERLRAECDKAVAECCRLNELFALKWDATQSAETEAMRDEIERLRARNVDLLAALKRVRRAVSNDKLKSQIDEIARAAIAKAEEK